MSQSNLLRETPGIATNSIWTVRRELWILLSILALYALISFSVWNSFETQPDDPTITDPAASYVLGQGFTSGCWYIQEADEFWAGNVPLHQFLLIPWFKVFGFGYGPVQAAELLYISLAMFLLWSGLLRSGCIASAGWRLGLVAFFLASDCSLGLATSGRPEPICILIACAAWFFLTAKNRFVSWGGLIGCGLLAPWAGLQLALFFAVLGIGTLCLFQRRYFLEVMALAGGGLLGSLSLLLFYNQMGVLDRFLLSISPHTGIGTIHTATTGVEFVRDWGHRLGAFMNVNIGWAIVLSLWACWLNLADKRARHLIAMTLGCIFAIPACFAGIGVFPIYYGSFLLLPLSVCLFALFSRQQQAIENASRKRMLVFLLVISAAMPGAYFWRVAVQGVPALLHNNQERMAAFVQKTTHLDDVAYVDRRLWYATKPQVEKTLSLFWQTHAKTSKDRDKVSVVIALANSHFVDVLPGEWRATGEALEVPDFHRFYRLFQKTPAQRFEVYRRVDQP
ncbi:MAG: hypothetical protein NTZ46_05940 [Verrucomicrobia bacterium]|nr:hypothetical protein [Verrucomicrobiota bacterium]